jgi:hypothetical protein
MVRHSVAVCVVGALLAGCSGDQPATTQSEFTAPLFAVGGNTDMNLGTHLRGEEEVLNVAEGAPHPRDSHAQGQANFRVNDDGTVDFKLIASNIDNVIMAHIHCGRPGENGPIRMWLSPNIGPSGAALPSGGGAQDGVLAQGTFNPTNIVCPAANVGTNMALLEAMRAGLTYVNVHTNDGVAPTNTGPGDFPSGEVRGQIDHPKGR